MTRNEKIFVMYAIRPQYGQTLKE